MATPRQHDARADSFKRIAKNLRVRATNDKSPTRCARNILKQVADELDFEAKTLRAMP